MKRLCLFFALARTLPAHPALHLDLSGEWRQQESAQARGQNDDISVVTVRRNA